MDAAKTADSNSVLNSIRERIASDVPTGWRLTTLGECFKWSSGGTPRRSDPSYYGGEIPWAVIGDLNDGVITETQSSITNAGFQNSSAKWVESGSVLVAMYGSIGKLAIAGRRLTTNQAIAFTKPDPVDPKYLYYYLLWQRPSLARLGKGATQLNISQTVLKQFPFLLAPPNEQRRVVAEIDKQFSSLEEAVANLKRIKANLKRYKAAVLTAAVKGELVPNEYEIATRADEAVKSGGDLLGEILAAHRSCWQGRGRYKEPAGPRTEWLFPLPKGWTWATVGQIAYSVKDGPHYSPKYSDSGIPFISGGNVRPEGIDFSTTKFISPNLHAELSKRCKPDYGDLLYTKGGTTGIARVNTERREFNVWVHVAVLKICPNVNPFYVQHALNSDHCYKQAQLYTHGVANQDLGLTRMVRITIPIPPRPQQDRIVIEVDRRLSVVSGLEADVDANLDRAVGIRRAMIARHFHAQGY